MQSAGTGGEDRAAEVAIPKPTRRLARQREEFQHYRTEREASERRSMVRGLIVVAMVVLAGSMARAGLERVFVHGWWRP